MSHHGHPGEPSTSPPAAYASTTMPIINEPFDPPGSVRMTKELHLVYSDDRKPVVNQYLRHHKVGNGQHGQVWVCTDMSDPNRRQLAIKAVKRKNPRAEKVKMLRAGAYRPIPQQPHTPLSEKISDAEQKIRKEIAIMKKLRHGHIVRLIEVIDDKLNDRIYMVMEYLSGGEIKWRVKLREEPAYYEPILRLDQVRRIIRDVILGLEYLHYQGIIHRDIKPGNLLWTADRQMVKISDFGVSHFSYAQRLAAAGRSKVEADDTDPLLLDDSDLSKRSGTPSFLAPEIISEYEISKPKGSDASPTSTTTSSFLSSATAHASPTTAARVPKKKITKAIDVWALGVTLYCLLFGDCPFHPPPGIGGSAAEFALYTVICNEDWAPRENMASERIPTGGRHPKKDAPAESQVVMRILDKLLQKDQNKRMTLDQLKREDWFLSDIPNKKEWLRETAPRKIDMVTITDGEAATALTKALFSWGWGKRITNQISKLVWRPRTTAPTPASVRSEQELKAAASQNKQKSASARASRDPMSAVISSRAKGKQRAGISDMLGNASTPNINRRKSVEAWARDTVQPFLGRRGSDAPPLPANYKAVSRPSSRHFSASGHEDPHERAKYRFSLPPWRYKKSANQSQTQSQASSPLETLSNMSMYNEQTGASPHSKSAGWMPYEHSRRSDDLLRHHGRAGSLKAAPSIAETCDFTAARRASSWGDPSSSSSAAAATVTVIGAGRQTAEDMMSIGSGEHEPLSDDALMMGAGGIANDPITLTSGLPLGLARVASDMVITGAGSAALRHPQPERLIIGAGPTGYYAAAQGEAMSPAGPSETGVAYVQRSATTSPSPLVQVAYDSSSEYGQWGQRHPGELQEEDDAASYNSDASEFFRANEEPGTMEADMQTARRIMRHMYPSDEDGHGNRDNEDDGEDGDDESDDDEEQTYAIEVKRRRPSESFSVASPPPMSPLSPSSP